MAAADLDAERRDVAEAHGVVRFGEDGLGQVAADFAGIDVESGDELDVADVVPAQADVHEAGHELVGRGGAVPGHALDEGGRAVADADDGNTYGWLMGRAHASQA